MRAGPRLLLVADHGGPFDVLYAAFGRTSHAIWVLGKAASQRARAIKLSFVPHGSVRNPKAFLLQHKIDAIVRGTSEEPKVITLEDVWGKLALKTNTPLFVLEDFPLNYRWPRHEKPLAVFAEFRRPQRLGASRSVLLFVGNPRYVRCGTVRKVRKMPTILWAGQPDGIWSYRTVQDLLKACAETNVRILFRAHPRDAYYRQGRYRPLARQSLIPWKDISDERMTPALWKTIDLVVTQYSTMALEAAQWGVPAVFILLPEAGQASMRHFKGHTYLPWCQMGAAFEIRSQKMLKPVLKKALTSPSARLTVLNNFARISRRNQLSAAKIQRKIKQILNSHRSPT